MKLEVTELGPMKRAIKIEVPKDVVNKEFDRAYTNLKRQVRIPGFRPGKAPIAMLEKRYAKAVEQDVIQRLVPDYYQRAVQEADVSPVLVEIPPLERMKAQRNDSLTFTATVEIKPKIELRDYRPPNPISLKPDPRTVSDDDVDKALENLRQSQARIDEAPKNTPLDEALYAVVNIEGFLEGEPIEGSKKESHLQQIGSNEPVLGVKIDEALIGKTEGETAEVVQEYPPTHPDERLAGKSVNFQISIVGVKQKNVPELDDEFAKDCGSYETLEQLKNKVRTELESSLKRAIEEAHKDKIVERLVEMHHFDLPDALVNREVKAMVRQQLMDEQRKKGASQADDEAHWEAEVKRLQQELAPDAKKRVKLALVLETIAEKEGITVSEEDLLEEIRKLAQSLQIPVENIQKMIQSGGDASRQEFHDRILADKALQLVYQFAVIQG
jgi:trigger factor